MSQSNLNKALIGALSTTLRNVPGDRPCHLIHFRRYTDPDRFGVHLVVGENGRYNTYTLGLTNEEGVKAVTKAFEPLTPEFNYLTPFANLPEDLQLFIRRQVIPLEFKRMTDEVLTDQIKVGLRARAGRTALLDTMSELAR